MNDETQDSINYNEFTTKTNNDFHKFNELIGSNHSTFVKQSKVKTFPNQSVFIKHLKEIGETEIADYIKAQNRVIEGWQSTNGLALKKIHELVEENNKLKKKYINLAQEHGYQVEVEK